MSASNSQQPESAASAEGKAPETRTLRPRQCSLQTAAAAPGELNSGSNKDNPVHKCSSVRAVRSRKPRTLASCAGSVQSPAETAAAVLQIMQNQDKSSEAGSARKAATSTAAGPATRRGRRKASAKSAAAASLSSSYNVASEVSAPAQPACVSAVSAQSLSESNISPGAESTGPVAVSSASGHSCNAVHSLQQEYLLSEPAYILPGGMTTIADTWLQDTEQRKLIAQAEQELEISTAQKASSAASELREPDAPVAAQSSIVFRQWAGQNMAPISLTEQISPYTARTFADLQENGSKAVLKRSGVEFAGCSGMYQPFLKQLLRHRDGMLTLAQLQRRNAAYRLKLQQQRELRRKMQKVALESVPEHDDGHYAEITDLLAQPVTEITRGCRDRSYSPLLQRGMRCFKVLSADELLVRCYPEIKDLASLLHADEEYFNASIMPVLYSLAQIMSVLPASQGNHDSAETGLLRHSLQVANESLEWTGRYCRSRNELRTNCRRITASFIGRFSLAVLALMHDAGKIYTDFTVRSLPAEHGEIWRPYMELCGTFISRLNLKTIWISFIAGRGVKHTELPDEFRIDLLLHGHPALCSEVKAFLFPEKYAGTTESPPEDRQNLSWLKSCVHKADASCVRCAHQEARADFIMPLSMQEQLDKALLTCIDSVVPDVFRDTGCGLYLCRDGLLFTAGGDFLKTFDAMLPSEHPLLLHLHHRDIEGIDDLSARRCWYCFVAEDALTYIQGYLLHVSEDVWLTLQQSMPVLDLMCAGPVPAELAQFTGIARLHHCELHIVQFHDIHIFFEPEAYTRRGISASADFDRTHGGLCCHVFPFVRKSKSGNSIVCQVPFPVC